MPLGSSPVLYQPPGRSRLQGCLSLAVICGAARRGMIRPKINIDILCRETLHLVPVPLLGTKLCCSSLTASVRAHQGVFVPGSSQGGRQRPATTGRYIRRECLARTGGLEA